MDPFFFPASVPKTGQPEFRLPFPRPHRYNLGNRIQSESFP